MGRTARRHGPARSVREYSGDIKLCINDFYGLAGRHSLALTVRCGSSEAFLLHSIANSITFRKVAPVYE